MAVFLRQLPVKCGWVVAVDMLHLSGVHKRQGRIILLGIRTHNSSRFFTIITKTCSKSVCSGTERQRSLRGTSSSPVKSVLGNDLSAKR